MDRLEEQVLETVIGSATDPQVLQDRMAQSQEEAKRQVEMLQSSVERKERALDRWLADYLEGYLTRSEFYPKKKELEQQIEALTTQLKEKQEVLTRLDGAAIGSDLEKLVGEPVEAFRRAWYDRSNLKEVKAFFRRIDLQIVVPGDTENTGATRKPSITSMAS